MRTPTLIVILAILPGCEKDIIDPGRRDTGVIPDAGIDGPLALQAGMTFTYQAILTYRSDAVAEETSNYMITVTIVSVDDQGREGQSSLVFTATGMQTLNDDWQPTSDFDLWVARLGPSLATDSMSAAAVTDPLTDPPTIPAAPTPPKQLPQGGSFFLDTRVLSEIGNAFTEAHQGQQPQLIAPEMSGNGKWAFTYTGLEPDAPDPANIYFLLNKRRSIRLEYDPGGWLTRIDENLGDSNSPPFSNARLILISGP